MSQNHETNLALFIDFDNVALGARDARQRFDVRLLMQRILEKGKIIVKKAYADWHYYKEHMTALHESAIELIEVPMPRISGKNSADIRLVVDAMDLCYSKDHIDTFVIVSGDSDFSPLVSKLRENNKRVIGVGMKNSSSHLLISNCDEFIFYDDIYREQQRQSSAVSAVVPGDKRQLFDFLISTVQSLLQESRGTLYSSLIKDTMTRKQPDFNERAHGFSTFGDLLDEARRLGLLIVERDARAGGTWVVQGLGDGAVADAVPGSRGSRRRRRSGGRNGDKRGDRKSQRDESAAAAGDAAPEKVETEAAAPADEATAETVDKPAKKTVKKTTKKAAPAKKKVASRKTTTKKTAKKAASKKTTKKAAARKTTKKAAGEAASKKTTKKAAKKTTRKTTKKAAKKTTKKVEKKEPAGDS